MASELITPEQPTGKLPDYVREPSWRPDPDRVRVRTVKTKLGPRMLTAQELAFIDTYLQYGVAVEAARVAGYSMPSAQGQEIRRRLSLPIEEERDWRARNAEAEAPEILATLSKWMRNGGDAGSATSVKAAELLGRAKGILTDKLDIRIDRVNLREEIRSALKNPQKLIESAIAEDAEFTVIESSESRDSSLAPADQK